MSVAAGLGQIAFYILLVVLVVRGIVYLNNKKQKEKED